MFRLAVLSDEIALPPCTLKRGSHIAALRRVIEEKYLDRVVPEVGLVVALYDVLEVKDCFIFPGDFRDSFGEAASTATFRVVVFRPEGGALLRGRLVESTTTGIRVSLEFFNDVEIPAHELMQPAFFDARNKIWVWQHSDHELFPYDLGVDLLFKVKSVALSTEVAVGDKRLAIARRVGAGAGAGVGAGAGTGGGGGAGGIMQIDSSASNHARPQPPMLIIGSVNESVSVLSTGGLHPLIHKRLLLLYVR